MSRRRRIAIASAALLLGLLAVVSVVVVSVTQTAYGRDRIRELVIASITKSALGKWHIGAVRGGLFAGFEIDSLEIRDADDSLFVATGPVRFEYDLRDILDRRILLKRLEIQRPTIHLTEYAPRDWNYDRLFRKSTVPRPVSLERSFGDFIRAETLIIHGGTFRLSQPWRPDTLLTRAQADSSVRFNLARQDLEIVRSEGGYARIRRFENLELNTLVRWTHPDSSGRFFDIQEMDVLSHDPPLDGRNIRGTVLVVSDSVWINARHFELPASKGSVAGKITSGSGLPTRYDLSIQGDSVALADVNWIYPRLPIEGGGPVNIEVRNNASNLRLMEYTLSAMDLRTTASRLRGGMTIGVGGPVIRFTNVDLDAAPLDFRLIEVLGGGPMPAPWKGQFNGRVLAPGGPVNRFVVDDLTFTFADGNVPFAISSGRASGELDITRPADAVFRGFDVDFTQLDLRTPEFLFPEFPRHGGIAAGRAHLDSLWSDVRFSDADFELRRVPAAPSRFTGSGRITMAEPQVIFDVDLNSNPMSFDAFGAAFPGFPLRGTMSGPFRAVGPMSALSVQTELSGNAGAFTWSGMIDYSLPGYGARGRGTMRNLDMRALLGRNDLPRTRLNGVATLDLSGDSLANVAGSLVLAGDVSEVDVVRIEPSRASLRFGSGVMQVDSVSLLTSHGVMTANGGALGLTRSTTDSVRLHIEVDSLALLPPFMARMVALADTGARFAVDSLHGSARMDGFVSGALGDLSLRGILEGRNILFEGSGARRISATVAATGIFSSAIEGTLQLRADSATVSGVNFSAMNAAIDMDANRSTDFRVDGRTYGGADIMTKGSSSFAGDLTSIVLDSLQFDIQSNRWNLASPGRLSSSGTGFTVDRLQMIATSGASASISGSAPASGAMDFQFNAQRFPVLDIARIFGKRTSFQGLAQIDVGVTGTRAAPLLTLRASADSSGFSDNRIERLVADARYADRRMAGEFVIHHDGSRALTVTASVPVDLRLDRAGDTGNRFPDDAPVSGRISASGVELGVIEPFFPQVREASGRLSAAIDIAGTVSNPRLNGSLVIDSGRAYLPDVGVGLRTLMADIAFTGDSAVVRRFSTGYDGGAVADTASISGHVELDDFRDPLLSLNFFARNFRVVQLSRVADLYINSGLQLNGRYRAASLGGYVSVDKGSLYIPELAQKRLIELHAIDSTLVASRDFTPPVPSALLQNLELRGVVVTVGDQVWLRSAAGNTNIQLGGEVSMTSVRAPAPASRRATAPSAADSIYLLALEGTLNADRGDYRLDLGVVQRKFQVEPGGTVTFFGEPELNPVLNISAVRSVRRVSGQDAGRDIRIRVRLVGSLSSYQLVFESVDGLELSQSDLISYLVTGSPSFELGAAGNENLRTAFGILLPSLGTILGDRFAGSRFDLFQLELAPLGENERLGESLRDALKRARVGVGKQLGNRTFISANTNLCRLGGFLEGESATTEELIQSFGVRLEHSLNHNFSVALSAEPSTAAARCAAAGSSARGLISSPPQFGFDIFKVWRF